MKMAILQIVLAVTLLSVASASPYQTVSVLDDGSYQFFYETGDDAGNQMRTERRGPDGVVTGSYAYKDPNGEKRVVNYRADDLGYVAQGDVSVPGAPAGQMPPETQDIQPWTENQDATTDVTVPKKTGDETSDKKKQDIKKDEPKSHEDEDEESDEDEDDVKPIKLPEASEDAPPEGFPIGFFTHQFQNVRRLAEPTKSEELKMNDGSAEEESTDKDKKETVSPHHPAGPVVHHGPNQHFVHPNWAAAGPVPYGYGFQHQPVSYVYSYNHPQAHGYYYFY